MYYKSGNLQRAEDLMHESFIRLYENCTKVIFAKAKSFLYTVANRLFLNEVTHQKVVLNFEKSSNLEKTFNESPDFVMEEKEFKEKLEKAISSLTEAQREAFLMNRIDKLSYQEIADRLDISVKAVEKRIHLAMISLKENLEELKFRKI
jgi:RNA polymerase sigma-70 factor (ECF subfamily)